MMGKLADDLTQGLSDMAGVIPRVAHLLFATSHSVPDTHEFFVEASFIEIYNEKVRDLLDPTQSELKIRESPKMGVHITGLTKKHVQSSFGVGSVLNKGFQNRTVASTRYNSESSRSHAIFELNIRQKYLDKASGEKMSSTSKINLVDLAGSERSDKVGTTGAALVEGNNINKSLTVLGRCIKALVQISKLPPEKKPKEAKGIKGKKAAKAAKESSGASSALVVPFRESVLTWYLRESLSGNSRTTMLATVSPVALNHEESMSTLRYAASAKNIKTASQKNEDPMEAKVRSLAEEIVKLKAALEAASSGGPKKLHALGDIDLSEMTEDERLEYLNRLESDLNLESDYSRQSSFSRGSSVYASSEGLLATFPMLSCLNKDEMLSHAMTVPITAQPDQPFCIGRDGGGRENDFVLNGVGIQQRHCTIEQVGTGDDVSYVVSNAGRGAVVLINGQSLEEIGQPAPLKHLDRITLGPCRLLAVFLLEPLTPEEKSQWTYETAFAELMHRESLQWTLLSPQRRRLLDKLKEAEILYVEQANAIAIDMCTCLRFRATIILGDGVPLLRKAEATVDEVLEAGDCEVVIVCQANPADIVETREDQIRAIAIMEEKQKDEAEAAAHLAAAQADPQQVLFRVESDMLMGEIERGEDEGLEDFLSSNADHLLDDFETSFDELAISSSPRDHRHRSQKEELERMNNLTLFEMKMGQFEELLAELKVTYSYVASLSQGVSDDVNLDDGSTDVNNTVQAIFDTVDCDGSGFIDRAEIAAAFKLFDETAIDPDFCEHMMDNLIPENMGGLDFDHFSAFLVKFLQHQCLHKLEPYVSNQPLFVALGGRDLVDAISEERKKEQALELRNAELEHEIAELKRKAKKAKAPKKKSKDKDGKKGGDDEEPSQGPTRSNSVLAAAETAEAVEHDLEAEGLDAEGELGVLKFLTHAGLEPFGPKLVAMGVDNVSDLLDPDLVGDDELSEAGMTSEDVEIFRDAVARRREKAQEFETAIAKASVNGLEGSVHEDFDPTIIGLDALTEVPVIIMNARSKRKLFAQAGKRPTIFETWNKGFGAGPEEHTFKDNKWWLVPQKSANNSTYVIVNAHSSRKLYAKQLRPGAIWEKEVGAVSADDTSIENSWNIVPEADGTYTLQNASTQRRLYARIQKPGDAWTNGVGAAPGDASSTDTKWYLIPDPAAIPQQPQVDKAAKAAATEKKAVKKKKAKAPK
jgi:hypothetical protein